MLNRIRLLHAQVDLPNVTLADKSAGMLEARSLADSVDQMIGEQAYRGLVSIRYARAQRDYYVALLGEKQSMTAEDAVQHQSLAEHAKEQAHAILIAYPEAGNEPENYSSLFMSTMRESRECDL
jgi:hypothetical protein